MELRHLRYFLALAERLNFTQAAAQVHVTQSTLSHQIAQLEGELDVKLFDRAERRVTLTAAGELFLPRAMKALAEIDSGIALMNTPRKTMTGQLRVGTTPTLNMEVVPQCLALFLRDHPSMRVLVDEGTGDSLIADMRAGRLDLLVAYRPFDLSGLVFEPLYTEEMVVVVNRDHPFARRKRLRVVELHQRELVLTPRKFTTRVQLDEAFAAAGAEPVVSMETSSIAAMLKLVQQAPLATIISRSAVSEHLGLHLIPMEGPTVVRTPGLIWLEDRVRTPAVASFAALVRT
ncbi:MAG TPA: LysR substrate-binding domain-containing protein, partial [Ramlibacter sp.]|nr:LysR substrate-binding domain-containing protein [Ramlibacter sp.]